MTEAQECLYYIAENMRMDKSISKEGYEYFQQAIKALEQEPILDKIRAEIKKELKRSFQRTMDEYDIATGLRKALEIIDKYKAESEER